MEKGVAVVLGVLGLLGSAHPADACSQSCQPGGLLPGHGATVPANARGFLWNPTYGHGLQPGLRLTQVGRPTPLAIAFDMSGQFPVIVQPVDPLIAGETYVLEELGGCTPLRVEFTAGPAAPLPSSLGTLRLGERARRDLEVSDPGGGCSVVVEASVLELSVELSAEATPWKDLLAFSTFVDGDRYLPKSALLQAIPPGESWQGRGEDLLFHTCGQPAPGARDVEIHATVPGTGEILSTQSEHTTVSCDGGGCATSRPASLGFVLLALLALVQSTKR
jgi:hypothetical protein